ncbi:hypothetical protein ABK040_015805 [Willaertia magna]
MITDTTTNSIISTINTTTVNPMITVFLNDRSKDIPFNVKEHDSLSHLNQSICQTFKALKYQKKVKLNVQMKNICNEIIKFSSNGSWKILFNELLKNNSITLYIEKKKTKLTDEEKELKRKEKKELREQQKLLRKQERELSKEKKVKQHNKEKETSDDEEDLISKEFESIELLEEEEPKRRRKQMDDKIKEERKKERELKKLEKKKLREKKKQQLKEEQSIRENELNEMKRIYLDGNNMMYVTKVFRDLTLKRRNRKLAEQLLIKIAKLFKNMK